LPTIVLIGCAHIHTADYLRAMQVAGDIKVAAVFDRDVDRASAIAEQVGAAVAANYNELADHQPDGVMILSETMHHENDVAQALSLDCPIFLEKPLATTSDAAERIADAIASSGKAFHTGFFLRTVPAFVRLRQFLQNGQLGRIMEARFRFSHDGAIAGWLDTDSWITDPELAGYGGFGDLSLHGADLLAWLLGQPVTHGSALMGRTDLRCDDHGAAVLSFAGGTLGILESSWVDPIPRFELRITGAIGKAELYENKHLIVRTRQKSSTVESTSDTREEDLGEVRLDAASGLIPFLRVLRSNEDRADLVPIADALAANKLIDKLYRQ
jgi:1,5-anhydro-D-fructose reductase (1,5-anhydro-D-mannitol-forming)